HRPPYPPPFPYTPLFHLLVSRGLPRPNSPGAMSKRCEPSAIIRTRRCSGRNIFLRMRIGALVALVCLASCRTRPLSRIAQQSDSLDLTQLVPRDSTDSALVVPRVITTPSVVLFWLRRSEERRVGQELRGWV